MEKGWIAQRQYHGHGGSGHAVRSDASLVVEDRQEGQSEGQDCEMALAEPEAKEVTTAPPVLKQCVRVQEAAKGYGALAAVDAKNRGLSNGGL